MRIGEEKRERTGKRIGSVDFSEQFAGNRKEEKEALFVIIW